MIYRDKHLILRVFVVNMRSSRDHDRQQQSVPQSQQGTMSDSLAIRTDLAVKFSQSRPNRLDRNKYQKAGVNSGDTDDGINRYSICRPRPSAEKDKPRA